MASKLLLALLSSALAVSVTTKVYADEEKKPESPQAQQIVAEGEEKSDEKKADLIAEGDEKSDEKKADLIAEGDEKSDEKKADLISA